VQTPATTNHNELIGSPRDKPATATAVAPSKEIAIHISIFMKRMKKV
jgi:hypothetical protein